VRTICLDPGHGGKDPGHRTGSRLEKAYTLALAREVRSKLVAAGFNVVLTRREDEYVDHPERTSMASRLKADLFVSLHFNASPDGSSDANGFEVYAMTPEGARSTNISRDIGSLKAWSGNEADGENLLLAYQVQRALLQRLPGSEDRGVRRARFLVLRLSEMPAIRINDFKPCIPGEVASPPPIPQAVVSDVRRLERPAPRAHTVARCRNFPSFSASCWPAFWPVLRRSALWGAGICPWRTGPA
jgi:hypothetical protein